MTAYVQMQRAVIMSGEKKKAKKEVAARHWANEEQQKD